jgi:THO complex subunit 4
VDTVWTHDLYQEQEEEEDVAPQEDFGNGRPRGLETGTRLQITNLAYSVLSEDLKDLFEELGDVKRATVNFDKSGRSLGTATVVFSRRGDAVAAVKKYNGVPLDDSPMKITLVGSALGGSGGVAQGNNFRAIHDEALTISVGAPSRRRIVAAGGNRGRPRLSTGRNVRIGGGGGGGFRGGRGRGGRRGGFGSRKQPATMEELDAEMDAYNQEANE